MIKITKIATVIIIVLTISLCASKLLPQSKEIDQMEIIKVVGLDYEDNKKDGKLQFLLQWKKMIVVAMMKMHKNNQKHKKL